jgi:hypothetical protein
VIVPRVKMEYESIATYKLAVSFFTVPATLLAVAAAGWLLWGRWGAAAAPLVATLLGLAALGWRERWGRVREDVAVYLRLLDRPRLKGRLAAQRAELVQEFDAVLERMGRGAGAPPEAAP